jgi:HAD superfamily hydrolase (TIGR01509 family)
MVRGVIFDMDGLMLDSERLTSGFWKQAGERIGADIPMEFLDSFRGRNPQAIQEAFLEQFGPEFEFERCRDIKTQLQHEYVKKEGMPLKKGLTELLDYLKEKGIRMAVATSTDRRLADAMLEKAGVREYFDAFVYGDMVERSKPYPDIFLKAAEEIGVTIEECLVLEDSIAGVEAGKASGGYIIHIPDIILVPDAVKEGITAQFESLFDVIGWIESRNY